MSTDEKKVGAVYVGWSTFKNAIDILTQAMPNKINRTVFPALAGGVQGQLLTGLKFLGLVTDDGTPTEALHAIAVRDEAERKKELSKVLRTSYPELFALNLTKTTPGELRDQMGKSYGVSGATLDRAMRFFIAAAGHSGIELSSYVAKGKAGNGPVIRKRRSAKGKGQVPPPVVETPEPRSGAGTSKSVNLASGGKLTLSATLDLFSLSPEDRAFVFSLIDKLEGYAKENQATTSEEESS